MAKKDNKGSSNKSAPFYVQLKGRKYPGYPKLPLMADARVNVQGQVKKQEKKLREHINLQTNKKLSMRLSKISKKGKTATQPGRRDRGFNKRETLGFTTIFDGKVFEKINAFVANDTYEAGKMALRIATNEGIQLTKDQYYVMKSQTSSNTKLKSKWHGNTQKQDGDIYETLGDSLGYYHKNKKGITYAWPAQNLPITQMASIQVGSFDKGTPMDPKTGELTTAQKPTGVFGSRMTRKKKSLTQLYAKRVYSFPRKTSPLAGTMKARLKGQ